MQECGHLHSVDIDNQTVNRAASNNQLIMNCKWGQGIDPPLAFGMCGETGRRGGRVANVDDSSSSSLLCEVAFDCELVTCSCYLLLLSGLTQSPLPRTKGERVDGGEPIIGQAALIVWLNSWLIEWEMGGRCCV